MQSLLYFYVVSGKVFGVRFDMFLKKQRYKPDTISNLESLVRLPTRYNIQSRIFSSLTHQRRGLMLIKIFIKMDYDTLLTTRGICPKHKTLNHQFKVW